MAEKPTQKRVVAREAGPKGRKEAPVRGGGRLDAATQRRAIEVEISGAPSRLRQAARRLSASGKPQRVLVVPQTDFPKAREAMRRAGVSGTLRNLTGTRSSHVRRSRATRRSAASRKK